TVPTSHTIIFIASPWADNQFDEGEVVGSTLEDDLPLDIFIRIGCTAPRINEFVEALQQFSLGFLANFEYDTNLKKAIVEQQARFSAPEKQDTTVLDVYEKLEARGDNLNRRVFRTQA